MGVMKTQTKSLRKRSASTKRRTAKETRAGFAVKILPHAPLELVTLDEAARAVGKTAHNIRDYIQRGRIVKYNSGGKRITRAQNGELRVSLYELRAFLSLVAQGNEKHHHAGLHPELGFYTLAERERTKHVHRLHPYLGKFIPQLVEWFLARYFKEDDVILDPFMGSGTTARACKKLNRNYIGFEINKEYAKLCNKTLE